MSSDRLDTVRVMSTPHASPGPMDLEDPTTWTAQCLSFIDSVTVELDRCDESWRSTSPSDLGYSLSHVDRQFEIEDELRSEVIADDLILLSHFTRLLPHQIDEIRENGMRPLSQELHEERQRRASEITGINVQNALRRPRDWYQHRENQLWAVAPLRPAALEGGDGLTCFLDHYGGEASYQGRRENGAIERLTNESVPRIVQFAAPSSAMNTFTAIWKVLAAQCAGNRDAWHEWYVNRPIPVDRVLDLVDPDHPHWPYDEQA